MNVALQQANKIDREIKSKKPVGYLLNQKSVIIVQQ